MDKFWMKDGEFTPLNAEQLKELSKDQRNAYIKDKNDALEKKINSRIDQMLEKANAELKKEVDALRAEIDGKEIDAKMAQYDRVLEKLQTDIDKEDEKEKDGFKEFKEKFSKIRKGIEFEVKATATRATVDSSTMAERLPGIGRLASPKFTFTDFFRVIPLGPNNNGTIRYMDWDSTAISRAAEATEEGDTYAESTADFKEYSVSLEKITDSIPVSEEFLEDVDFAQSELTWFLQDNILRKENDYLWDGTGTTPQIEGLYTRVTAFNTATYSGATTTTPNLIDLKDVLMTEIANGKDGKYDPANMVMFVNWTDFMELALKKDSDGRRLYSKQEILDMGIVPNSYVTANTAAIGDVNYARVYLNKAYSMEIGRDGNDFTKGLYTMRADKRMALVIREADKDAFLKVTDISAALTAITT